MGKSLQWEHSLSRRFKDAAKPLSVQRPVFITAADFLLSDIFPFVRYFFFCGILSACFALSVLSALSAFTVSSVASSAGSRFFIFLSLYIPPKTSLSPHNTLPDPYPGTGHVLLLPRSAAPLDMRQLHKALLTFPQKSSHPDLRG